jgi:hypothetical protein
MEVTLTPPNVQTPVVPNAASTPVPSTGVLTNLDTIIHQAVNAESLIAGIIAMFFPGLAPYMPKILAVVNGLAAILDQVTGITPPPTTGLPTP